MVAGLRNFAPAPNPSITPQAIAGALQGQRPVWQVNTDLPPSDSPEEALHNAELRAATAIPQFGTVAPEPVLPFRSLVGQNYSVPNANENIPIMQRLTGETPGKVTKPEASAFLKQMEQTNPNLFNYAKALNAQAKGNFQSQDVINRRAQFKIVDPNEIKPKSTTDQLRDWLRPPK